MIPIRNRVTSGHPGLSPATISVFILVFAASIVSRLPNASIQGRLWAEEGSVYFQAAWNEHWSVALTTVHTGYLNLSATVATLLARYLVPLSAVPRVTMGFALAIQCIPAVLILSSRDKWLNHPLTAGLALILIAFAPGGLETWLTSISSQHHLTLATALILSFETPATAGMVMFQCLILMLAALSGPGAWMLLPALALRSILDKSMARTVQFIALLAGVAVAAIFFVPSDRSVGMPLQMLGAVIFIKHIAISFLPMLNARYIGNKFIVMFREGGTPLWPLLLSIAALAMMFGAAVLSRARTAIWLLLCGTMLAGGGYLGAVQEKIYLLDVGFGGRYAFAPQVLFSLALLCLARSGLAQLRQPAAILATWVIVVQILDLYQPNSYFDHGPSWASAVSNWENGQSRSLALWPEGWTPQLSLDRREIPSLSK